MNMPAVGPITWQEFSQQYLPEDNNNLTIGGITLRKAFRKYMDQQAECKLSVAAEVTLERYAFHKAGQKYHTKTVLTQEKASKVFKYYYETLKEVTAELSVKDEMVKPVKKKVPKGLGRLSTFSASMVETYLNPRQKAFVQELLHLSHKIDHSTKHFIEEDPHLDFKRIFKLELLAKKLAYFNPKNGERFIFPVDGKLVEYEAKEIHLWQGMFAHGFKPVDPDEEAPPILAFSGTFISVSHRGALAKIAADFDPRGVGYIAYSNGKGEIEKWLNEVKGDVLITGHSLGGALARYVAIDHADRTKACFTFSAPGISAKYGKKWKKINQIPMYNFNHREDKIPKLGQSYVGTNYEVICSVEKTVNKKLSAQNSIHNKRLFGRQVCLLSKTNPKIKTIWKQRAVAIIPFIFFMSLLCINRVLFGTASRPYISLFGPIRWAWRKIVTEKIAAKHFHHHAAGAA